MNPVRNSSALALILGLVASLGATAAPIIAIQPGAQAVPVGGTLTADVVATNLSNEFIGAFDLTIDWDPLLLAFDSLSFDTFLDGPALSIQGFTPGAGSLNVFEVSYSALAGQTGNDPFRLFSVSFLSLGEGVSRVDFSSTVSQILSDGSGEEFGNAGFTGGTVTATPATTVPEPGTPALLGLGLVGVGLAARGRRSA